MSSAVVLKGQIERYSCSKRAANFISPEAEGSASTGAMAAALAGESGMAMSLISASGSATEEADYVEFSISGQTVKGWLKQSPFAEGDSVEVVAEEVPSGLDVMAVVRPHDRIIALRPYLSMGRRAYVFHLLKWWWWTTAIFVILFDVPAFLFLSEGPNRFSFSENQALVDVLLFINGGLAFMCFLAFLIWAVKIGNAKARDAEKVFRALGWPEVHRINLQRTSKKMARGGESFGYGLHFFRY